LSMTTSAVKNRALRAAAKENAESGAGDQDDPPDPEASTGSIGVRSPKKATQYYHCTNCDEDVTRDMERCPMCEQSLNWPEGI